MKSKNYIKHNYLIPIEQFKYKFCVKQNIVFIGISFISILTISILTNSFLTKAVNNEQPTSYKYYKSIEIEKGDTLWSIASEYMDEEHYKNKTEYIREVKQINSLGSDKIISGRHIIIPYYSYEFLCSK